MKIEILGTGCAKCKKLEANARDAIKELDIEKTEIEKITDIVEITDRVSITPAIAVDGKIKAEGRIPEIKEIKEWLSE